MEKEFVEIFNLYKNDVYRLAYSYTKCYSDSDDITQSVFIKLYKNFNRLNTKENIKNWLMKVTVNECKTLFLSAWKNKILPFTEKEENTLYQEEHKNDILQVLLELPKKYRIVMYLYYYEGYKIKEIANILNISETSIQTRLSRARNKLKEMLKGEWE